MGTTAFVPGAESRAAELERSGFCGRKRHFRFLWPETPERGGAVRSKAGSLEALVWACVVWECVVSVVYV